MSARNYMNARDKFAVAELIRKHIVKHGTYWRYKDGWSDEAIAEKFGKGASPQNVRAVRLAAFGQLIAGGGPKKTKNTDSLEQRIVNLESMVRRLCNELGVNYNG